VKLVRLWLAAGYRWIAVHRLGQAEWWEAKAARLEAKCK